MDKFRLKILCGAAALLLLAGVCCIGRGAAAHVIGKNVAGEAKICVVVDAGHGSGNLRKVTKGKEIQKERQPLSLILQLNKS